MYRTDMTSATCGHARVSAPGTGRGTAGQRLVHPVHLVHGQEPGRFGEAVRVDGVELVAHDQGFPVAADNRGIVRIFASSARLAGGELTALVTSQRRQRGHGWSVAGQSLLRAIDFPLRVS